MRSVILYDGVCGLCNRLVRFVLKRDKRDRFYFAALQGGLAASILRRHGVAPRSLDTVYLVSLYDVPGERLLRRSEAIQEALANLGGVWSFFARVLNFFPRSGQDWLYNLIAGHRYQIFGKYDVCPLPAKAQRHKFLDLPENATGA